MAVVKMPDGTNVSFPDDMPPDQIKGLIAKKFPNEVASHLEDTASAIRSGMSWSQVAGQAVMNVPSSAADFASSVAQPFLHPVQTTENLGDIGKGILQKVGVVSGSDAEKYADAVGKFFMDRYGSIDNIKQTIAKDPVGVAADVATVLTGGGSALARAPGIAGKLGEAASAAGRVVDPLTAAGKVAKGAGKVAAEATGITTGAGSDAIKIAAQAGAEGGPAGKAFLDNLTGSADRTQIIADAKGAIQNLRDQRGQAYRSEMAKIGADNTVLSFGDIDKTVNNVVKKYKGVSVSPAVEDIQNQIRTAVEDWKELDPEEYHTAEGLDALKQKIGSIRDQTQYGTPARTAADQVYNAVKGTITDQAPEYAKVMKGYEEATSLIKEMESTLSAKPNANVDTTMRKLLSVLRNNVSTNYGRRADLIDILQKNGATNLLQKIAGQTLSSAAPRGLGRVLAGGEGASALGALGAGMPGAAALLGGGLAASSPALVGGAAYGLGATTRLPLRQLGQSAFQAGRLP